MTKWIGWSGSVTFFVFFDPDYIFTVILLIMVLSSKQVNSLL